MNDEPMLEVAKKEGSSSLVPWRARSEIIARGMRDASTLPPVSNESKMHRSGSLLEKFLMSNYFLMEETSDHTLKIHGPTRSIEEVRRDAEMGDSNWQSVLAFLYTRVPLSNLDEAVKWYRKAADQGYAPAQFNLGWMYDRGEGVPQDYAEAVKWYRKAADQGLSIAQFYLGTMYDKGEGVPQDYAEAVRWYRKAADQDVQDAQFNLGAMYENGKAWPRITQKQSNGTARPPTLVMRKHSSTSG